MYRKVLAWCAALTFRRVFLYGLLFAIAIEAVTVAFRYGLDLESTRDTASTIGQFTFGLRIHHGYIGVFLFILAWCFPLGLRHGLWILALGLLISDLAHHFLVLWPIEGNPQFDLVYPTHPYWNTK
jgi:hypothetical protein